MKQVCFPYEQRLQCCYGRGHAEMQMVTGTVKHRLLSFKKIKSNFQFPTLKYWTKLFVKTGIPSAATLTLISCIDCKIVFLF